MNYWAAPGLGGTVLHPDVVGLMETPNPRLKDIFNVICGFMGQEPREARKRTRKREFVICRQYYYFFARRLTNKSLQQIAEYCNCDHSTAHHGIKQINNLIETNRDERDRKTMLKHYLSAKLDEIS